MEKCRKVTRWAPTLLRWQFESHPCRVGKRSKCGCCPSIWAFAHRWIAKREAYPGIMLRKNVVMVAFLHTNGTL